MVVNAKQEGEIDRKHYQEEWDSRTYCLKLLPPADYHNTSSGGTLKVLINQKSALYPKLDKQGNFISFSTVPAMKNKKVLLEFIYMDDQRNTYTISDSLVLTSIPDTLQISH